MKLAKLELPGYKPIDEGATGLNPALASVKPAVLLNRLIPYLFVIAGLILLVFLIIGGFELMTSAGDPKKTEGAKGKITSALIGFVIIFLAYWLAQALGIMLGFSLLGD